MPDIQDGLQAAIFICLLVTLALTVMLAIIVGVLQYRYSGPPLQIQTQTRAQTQPRPHRPSVYYPTTRSSIENTYHIACLPGRPHFRNVDWSYGTFQDRLGSGPQLQLGDARDDELSVKKGWGHVSPHGQVEVPGTHGIAAEGSKDVDRGESTGDAAVAQQPMANENDDGDEVTEASSTPQATTPQRQVGSDWAERTRSGRIHSV